jgi:hypothetical protein
MMVPPNGNGRTTAAQERSHTFVSTRRDHRHPPQKYDENVATYPSIFDSIHLFAFSNMRHQLDKTVRVSEVVVCRSEHLPAIPLISG